MQQFLDDLAKLYPPDRLLTERAQLIPYESDGLTAFRMRPRAVVLPDVQEDVIETVRMCHIHGVPFVPRGSGTSLSGGALPVHDGIVIALNRLNRILSLDPEQRLAVVEPGVANLSVSQAAAPHGLYYAPDPSSQPVCTIGGNVAFNAGGAHCLKYGMTSNHVLRLKVVLPEAEVVELGSESLESVDSDWTGLFVGSEGLFGIALEVTLRLLSKPEAYHTMLAAYRSMEAAGDAVADVVASGLLPGAIEIMDNLTIQAVNQSLGAGYPPDASALLIVELEGETDQVNAESVRLQEIIRGSEAYSVNSAQDETERAMIWKGRKGAFAALGTISQAYIVQDGVVPRSQLGEALAEIDKISSHHGLRVANVFHAGDGNLHPNVLFDGSQVGMLERAEALADEIVEMCIRRGGSITGEHGVGMEKRKHLASLFSEDDLKVMQRLHRTLDPQAIANRGKMFPDSLKHLR